MQCVSKKVGMTVVPSENNDLVTIHLVMRWRVCMNYHNLNLWTEKDYLPMTFMDEMLDRLAGKGWYYFLDGYSVFNQICISQHTKKK